jgi:hypothetical protein
MKFGSILATCGHLALLLVMQNATAGERPNGVIGNTLCLNADPSDAMGTYGTIEKALETTKANHPNLSITSSIAVKLLSIWIKTRSRK